MGLLLAIARVLVFSPQSNFSWEGERQGKVRGRMLLVGGKDQISESTSRLLFAIFESPWFIQISLSKACEKLNDCTYLCTTNRPSPILKMVYI